jgi:hypothetical protein
MPMNDTMILLVPPNEWSCPRDTKECSAISRSITYHQIINRTTTQLDLIPKEKNQNTKELNFGKFN